MGPGRHQTGWSGPIEQIRHSEGAYRLRPAGLEGVVQVAGGIRHSAGLAAPEPGSPEAERLVELTLATLAFLAGDPATGLTDARRQWQAGVSSLEEGRADLAALRATLEARLAGPAPRMQRLVDALVAGEEARLGPGGGGGAPDPLTSFLAEPARPPLRRAGPRRPVGRRQRLDPPGPRRPVGRRRRLHRQRLRRPRSRHVIVLRALPGALVAAAAAVLAAVLPTGPAPLTSLLPNYLRPGAPGATAPPVASAPPAAPVPPPSAVPGHSADVPAPRAGGADRATGVPVGAGLTVVLTAAATPVTGTSPSPTVPVPPPATPPPTTPAPTTPAPTTQPPTPPGSNPAAPAPPAPPPSGPGTKGDQGRSPAPEGPARSGTHAGPTGHPAGHHKGGDA